MLLIGTKMIFEFIETDETESDSVYETGTGLVTVSIHPQRFTTKPKDHRVIGQIKQAMVVETGTIEDLAQDITLPAGPDKDGIGARSWCPAVLIGGASAEHWREQQLFALDIDDGLSLHKALERCETFD